MVDHPWLKRNLLLYFARYSVRASIRNRGEPDFGMFDHQLLDKIVKLTSKASFDDPLAELGCHDAVQQAKDKEVVLSTLLRNATIIGQKQEQQQQQQQQQQQRRRHQHQEHVFEVLGDHGNAWDQEVAAAAAAAACRATTSCARRASTTTC